MSSAEWKVAEMHGSFCAVRTVAGAVERSESVETKQQAKSLADLLNGRPALKRGMSQAEFYGLTMHIALQPKTRHALHDILVLGKTWKASATKYGVTESGILRAMRRLSAVNRSA